MWTCEFWINFVRFSIAKNFWVAFHLGHNCTLGCEGALYYSYKNCYILLWNYRIEAFVYSFDSSQNDLYDQLPENSSRWLSDRISRNLPVFWNNPFISFMWSFSTGWWRWSSDLCFKNWSHSLCPNWNRIVGYRMWWWNSRRICKLTQQHQLAVNGIRKIVNKNNYYGWLSLIFAEHTFAKLQRWFNTEFLKINKSFFKRFLYLFPCLSSLCGLQEWDFLKNVFAMPKFWLFTAKLTNYG